VTFGYCVGVYLVEKSTPPETSDLTDTYDHNGSLVIGTASFLNGNAISSLSNTCLVTQKGIHDWNNELSICQSDIFSLYSSPLGFHVSIECT
jgi:hypothetical protein